MAFVGFRVCNANLEALTITLFIIGASFINNCSVWAKHEQRSTDKCSKYSPFNCSHSLSLSSDHTAPFQAGRMLSAY